MKMDKLAVAKTSLFIAANSVATISTFSLQTMQLLIKNNYFGLSKLKIGLGESCMSQLLVIHRAIPVQTYIPILFLQQFRKKKLYLIR